MQGTHAALLSQNARPTFAANKRDFETRLTKSRVLMARGEWPAPMDELLEIVMRDKKWLDETPSQTFVAIPELLNPPKTKADQEIRNKTVSGIELAGQTAVVQDPQATLGSSYRRKLSMALN